MLICASSSSQLKLLKLFQGCFAGQLHANHPSRLTFSKLPSDTMTDSLAAFRDRRSKELRKLAEEHLQHECVPEFIAIETMLMLRSLRQSDRDILRSAGGKVSTHAQLGSLLGISFGLYCAIRLRSMRQAYFNAFRAMEKPIEIKFADGRTCGHLHAPTSVQPLTSVSASPNSRYHESTSTLQVE